MFAKMRSARKLWMKAVIRYISVDIIVMASEEKNNACLVLVKNVLTRTHHRPWVSIQKSTVSSAILQDWASCLACSYLANIYFM